MKEMVLLPVGDQSHIDTLLQRLNILVEQGREREFALLLPTSQLLHEYRERLVKTACRHLQLTTFDDLVTDAMKFGAPGVSSIDGETITEIIAQILRARAEDLPSFGRYANSRGMARDLAHVLGQIRRANITSESLAGSARTDQVLAELLLLWQDYLAFLQKRKLADIEAQYNLAAKCLSSVPWIQGVREFHVCWFLDFEPMQLKILDCLSGWGAKVSVWLPYGHEAHIPYLNETMNSLAKLGFVSRQESGQDRGHLTNALFITPPRKAEIPGVQSLAAPRIKQELDLVAREIKKLAGAGVCPGEICLVIPDQRKYLPVLRRLYKQYDIDLSIPLMTDLDRVPWIREILALWQAAASGWDRDSLLQVIGSVYVTAHLPQDYDGDSIEAALYGLSGNLRGRQWLVKFEQEISRLERQLEDLGDQWLLEGIKKPLDLYRQAKPGLKAWVDDMGSVLAGPKSPQEHCAIFRRLIESNAEKINPRGSSQEDVRDRAAAAKVNTVLDKYLACCTMLERSSPIGPGQFVEAILPWLEQDLALERSSPGAVRVLSPAQIKGMSFPYVFILGLNQGIFPHSTQEHWLLGRPELKVADSKSALAQEKIFFHSCVAAAEKGLTLSRQLPGVDQEAQISSFWRELDALVEGGLQETRLEGTDLLPRLEPEAVICPSQLAQRLVFDLARGKKHSGDMISWLADQRDYSFLTKASQAEQRRESPLAPDNMDGCLSRSAGILKNRFGRAVYSISRLEQYARCPFSFFARYCLGLEAAARDVPEWSALDRGTFLHWLLEQFYKDYDINTSDINGALTSLAQQWLEQKGFNSGSQIWRLRVREAVGMTRALIETDLSWLKRTGLRPLLHEASFGLNNPLVETVRPGDGEVSFHGKIDRIDIMEQDGETWAVVYDYKTSRAVTQKDIMAGKSLQIPVYLAAAPLFLKNKGFGNVRVMGGGYYVIKDAKLAGGIWNKEFTSHVGSLLGSLEQEEFAQLEQVLAKAAEGLHQGIISGNFVPNPDSSACSWCDFSACCRYDKNRFRLKAGGENVEA